MNEKVHIEVDEATAAVLEARAADVLAEDARRLADFQRGRDAVPWEDVKAWIHSWGTPACKPWRDSQ